MTFNWWRTAGLLGLLSALVATAFILAAASRRFYDVDHPVNLIFYFHVAVAWVGFLGLALAAVASAGYLLTRAMRFSWVAEAAVAVSFGFLTLTLATGMVWGRFIWNSWWEWSDVRLVTALVVWFVYAAYLLVRAQVRDRRGHAAAAVYSLLAFVTVPITYASTRLWQSPFHGTSMGTSSIDVHGMALAMVLVGSGLVYTYLVALRWQTHHLRERLSNQGEVMA